MREPQLPTIGSELGERSLPLPCNERILTEQKRLSNHTETSTKQESNETQGAPVVKSLICLSVAWYNQVNGSHRHGAKCPLGSSQLHHIYRQVGPYRSQHIVPDVSPYKQQSWGSCRKMIEVWTVNPG